MAMAAIDIERWHRDKPPVSVLLPAWNEAAMIRRCLDSLTALDWPDLEVIVCAGGDDGTLEIASQYESERVVVLEQRPGEGKQAALRRCFARARGDIIYLTDADCVVPADTFQAIIEPIVAGSEQVVTGDSCPLPEFLVHNVVAYQYHGERLASARLGGYTVGLHGRNTAVTRQALEAAGRFNWPALTGTDYALAEELQLRGYQIRHLTDAFVYSSYPKELSAYVSQRSRWIRNQILLGRKYRRWSLVLPTLASSLALALLLISTPLAVLGRHRLSAVIFLGWAAIALKRGRAVAKLDREMQSPATFFVTILMTPVEAWIRFKSLVSIAIPSQRWRW